MCKRNLRETALPYFLSACCLVGITGAIGCSINHDTESTSASLRYSDFQPSGEQTRQPPPSLNKTVLHGSRLYSDMLQNGNFTDAAILDGFHDALQPQSARPFRVEPTAQQKIHPEPNPNIPISERVLDNVSPLDANWHSQVGWTLVLDGNYSGAEAAYRQALRHNIHFAQAHLGLGMALMMQGNREGAISSYQEALEIQPDYPAALVHLGYVYTDGINGDQDFQRARTLFNQASKHGDPFAMLALVDLNTRQNHKG